MKLKEVLDQNNIFPALDVETKDEALLKMAEALYENNYINNTRQFIEDIYKREEIGETGIGNYIAIPHGQSDAVIETTISVAKLNNEIKWETLDGKGVRIIILFAVQNDPEFGETHLKLLAEVARKLAKEELKDELLAAETEVEMINALNTN